MKFATFWVFLENGGGDDSGGGLASPCSAYSSGPKSAGLSWDTAFSEARAVDNRRHDKAPYKIQSRYKPGEIRRRRRKLNFPREGPTRRISAECKIPEGLPRWQVQVAKMASCKLRRVELSELKRKDVCKVNPITTELVCLSGPLYLFAIPEKLM